MFINIGGKNTMSDTNANKIVIEVSSPIPEFILNDDYFIGLLELAAAQRRFFRPFITESLENTQMALELISNELK